METLREKLLARAEIKGLDDCWVWTKSLSSKGYGKFYSGRKPERDEVASRVSFEVFKGPIPDELIVCHTCDNRACINPNHLFVGTHSDNHQDMLRKGRGNAPKGEQNNRAKITAIEALAIRRSTGSSKEVAAQFGVSRTLVIAIRNRTRWAHLPEPSDA